MAPNICKIKSFYLIVKLIILISSNATFAIQFNHSAILDNNFKLLWNVEEDESITFEVQVKTLGYIALGFSLDGTLANADIVVGWIHQGHANLQDRHITQNSNGEPILDKSQDYTLLLGYENATHTILRFNRKLETCDTYDLAITNDTMRVIFMYSDEKPKKGIILPQMIPNFLQSYKGYHSLYLLQNSNYDAATIEADYHTMELRNVDVELPRGDDGVVWCNVLKLANFPTKEHLIKFEPVFDSTTSMKYLKQIILHECQLTSEELEMFSRENGHPCQNLPLLPCNAVVANWVRGSKGYTFPEEAGYPFDSNVGQYYLMETHYTPAAIGIDYPISSSYYKTQANDDVVEGNPEMVDNSGLRLYFTPTLRKYDAGILSIGIDPNWRHIIPPGQPRVISEGHCISECTENIFPSDGINIFSVMLRSQTIGREVKLRQVRGREELPMIVHDANLDSNFQEYRKLDHEVKVMPGDRIIAECLYDSTNRKTITLGGTTMHEEICLAYALYYPRQKELTSCHSIPSLPTVLQSLGIQELVQGSNPVTIQLPLQIAGMALETRLITYDWNKYFENFQYANKMGSFKPLCWSANNTLLPGTNLIEFFSPNTTFQRSELGQCNDRINDDPDLKNLSDLPVIVISDNSILDGGLDETGMSSKSKVSRSSSNSETMSYSQSATINKTSYLYCLVLTLIIVLF